MRTAADFDRFYAIADPWNIESLAFRDRVLRRFIPEIVRGRSVLELGCGEGHLTETIFADAAAITGIDISDVAIERAKRRNLSNARLETGDFLRTSFEGFDIIAALECVYYLARHEQEIFFAKIACEHRGKALLLSGPIIGQGEHRSYFTHAGLIETFTRHGMTVKAFRNLGINRRGPFTTLAALAARVTPSILDILPDSAIFQRCYVVAVR